MLVRIFEGTSWSTSQPLGDFEFDVLPGVGHKIVVAGETGWSAAPVRDIAHRVGDAEEPADIALLVAPMLASTDQSELPIALLDQAGRPQASASVPKAGPWA